MNNVYRSYRSGDQSVHALRGVSLALDRGSFTAVMGPSGSGKSTLLHCAAGLDRPSSGEVHLGEINLTRLSEKKLTKLRRQRMGFIFQAYNLLSSLTVQDNITLPMRLSGAPIDRDWATRLVAQIGISERLHHRPAELSGGQQQRAAIARALIARPEVILADEPTGALDSHTSAQVLDLIADTAKTLSQTVLMVTHNPVAASYAHRVVFLADGQIAHTAEAETATDVAHTMSQLSEA